MAGRQRRKLVSDGSTCQPRLSSSPARRIALADDLPVPCSCSRDVGEHADGRSLARPTDRQGQAGRCEAIREGLVQDEVSDPGARQPIRLGQGPQDDEVGKVLLQPGQAERLGRGAGRGLRELLVDAVDRHHRVEPVGDLADLVGGEPVGGRVVRRAEPDQARTGFRRRPAQLRRRLASIRSFAVDRHHPRAGEARLDVVHREGGCCDHHRVARTHHVRGEQPDQLVGAGSRHDPPIRHPDRGSDAAAQLAQAPGHRTREADPGGTNAVP